MALITSAATGDFSAGATWTGGVVPTVGDEARAATGHTITITANATCDEVSNAGTGIFTLNDGVTLTANVASKSATTTRNCLQFTAASPASASIVGNITGGINAVANNAVVNTGTGSLNITGNCTGGTGSQGGTNLGCNAVANTGSGTVTITGNCTAGSVNLNANGVLNSSAGTINIIGNCNGAAAAAFGAHNISSGTITITGNSTGGSAAGCHGANNFSTGTLTITGIATGGTNATAQGINNTSTGTVNLGRAKGAAYGPGNTSGLAAAVGASNAGLGVIEIQELEFGQYGMSPTSGTGIRLKKVSTNAAIFTYVDAGAAKTLVDATQGQMPAVTDVRTGVSYASGALTGTCAVPAASSVASGVPVDATTGTAALTPAAVWEYATRSLTTSSGATAAEIRTEMDSNSTKLANLDATVSSRLASSAYTAPSAAPTAAANATAVWSAATRTLTAGAGISASDVWSHATRTLTTSSGPTASEIRTEIDSNSTQLSAIKAKTDNLPASPAATGDIPSANITAIRAKTDALVTDRLAQCSTVATTGAQLAAALS